jgi:hypothetical protein
MKTQQEEKKVEKKITTHDATSSIDMNPIVSLKYYLKDYFPSIFFMLRAVFSARISFTSERKQRKHFSLALNLLTAAHSASTRDFRVFKSAQFDRSIAIIISREIYSI